LGGTHTLKIFGRFALSLGDWKEAAFLYCVLAGGQAASFVRKSAEKNRQK